MASEPMAIAATWGQNGVSVLPAATLPEPFPSRENQNLGEFPPIAPHSETKIVQVVDPKTPEGQRRLQEGRANAIRKSIFVKAILLHCRDCFGKIPVREDCEGHTLSDGGVCNLYAFNTAQKCRKSSKSAIRRAIRRECSSCGGEEERCGKCNLHLSPHQSDRVTPSLCHSKTFGLIQRATF